MPGRNKKTNMVIGTKDMERHKKCSRQHINNQQLTGSRVDIFNTPSNPQPADYQTHDCRSKKTLNYSHESI